MIRQYICRGLRLLLLVISCSSLSGCWFIFIPGSVTQSVVDGLTGSEGSHCVGPSTKVGDRVRLLDGKTGVVKSLSGTSRRCTMETAPIRALVEVD